MWAPRDMMIALGLMVALPNILGHGTLTVPVSRALRVSAGNASLPNGVALSGTCRVGACEWYTQKTVIPGPTTNCDAHYRTMGVACGHTSPSDFPCTPGHAVPWCAPGTAPVARGSSIAVARSASIASEPGVWEHPRSRELCLEDPGNG